MRVGFCKLLDGLGGATVGVAFAEDGVDGRALDLVVAGFDVLFVVRLGGVGVVWDVVALGLKLGDAGLELGDGGGDVGELDDVCLGGLGEEAEVGELVGDALALGQLIGDGCEHAGSERDVSEFDIDTGGADEALDDGQEGVGG